MKLVASRWQLRTLDAFALLVLLGSTVAAAGFVERTDTPLMVAFIVLSGGAWLTAYRRVEVAWAIAVGLVMRLAMFCWSPALSDDFYRFYWDGALWLSGYHVLDFVPSDAPATFIDQHASVLSAMNSAGYFTVYPPLAQLVYALSAWLGQSLSGAITWMRICLFAAECGIISLLYSLDPSPSKRGVVAYALLPIVALEVVGNLHFESLAVLGLLFGIYAFRQNRPWASGISLGFGVLAKLVPAIAGPALLAAWVRHSASAKTAPHSTGLSPPIRFLFGAVVMTGLGMLLFLMPADLTGFGESLDLYFRNFEFNGSLYGIARSIGYWIKGWNWISVVGPTLAGLAFLLILALAGLALLRGTRSLPETLLWSFGIYLACATTVHPWYVIYLVAIGALTPYRWPYLWAFTVLLSYDAYNHQPIEVPAILTALQYLPVYALAAYEWFTREGSAHHASQAAAKTRCTPRRIAPTALSRTYGASQDARGLPARPTTQIEQQLLPGQGQLLAPRKRASGKYMQPRLRQEGLRSVRGYRSVAPTCAPVSR